jgi:hypothetical protein
MFANCLHYFRRTKQVQLQEQRQLEDLKKKKIAAIEESQMEKEEHYSSLQDEADSKTRKLNKLFAKYQGICEELKDVSEEQQREREDMLDTIRTLTRQMKLKDMIIVGFMPRDDAEKVRPRDRPALGVLGFGIFSAVRPIGNLKYCATNHNPSIGVSIYVRPITTPHLMLCFCSVVWGTYIAPAISLSHGLLQAS